MTPLQIIDDDPGGGDTAVFGFEEDLMLAKMFEAIHLKDDEVFVTNVIKCGIPSSVQPQALHIETCLSYLQRQIALTSPELICTNCGVLSMNTGLVRKTAYLSCRPIILLFC